MPNSCGDWQIYATEAPNDFVAHYKGYVFHLTNRIGSTVGHLLSSISARIAELEALPLPKGHFIRPRAVWFDDKNGGFTWYVDYMRPHDHQPAATKAALLYQLKDGWALDDVQIYTWDLKFVKYHPSSDHFDTDHYDYYTRYLPNYLGGTPRDKSSDVEEYWITRQDMIALQENTKQIAEKSFENMADAFRQLKYLHVMRAVNCNLEALPRFEQRYDWSDLLQEFDIESDNIFTATVILDVFDINRFFNLLSKLPNDVDYHFRATRVYIFLPEKGLVSAEDEHIFDLHISIHPALLTDQRTSRARFNSYFDRIRAIIDEETSAGAEPT
jgi:hypothetical protein